MIASYALTGAAQPVIPYDLYVLAHLDKDCDERVIQAILALSLISMFRLCVCRLTAQCRKTPWLVTF